MACLEICRLKIDFSTGAPRALSAFRCTHRVYSCVSRILVVRAHDPAFDELVEAEEWVARRYRNAFKALADA